MTQEVRASLELSEDEWRAIDYLLVNRLTAMLLDDCAREEGPHGYKAIDLNALRTKIGPWALRARVHGVLPCPQNHEES